MHVVAVAGVVATVASGGVTAPPVVTGETTLDIPLDERRPEVAFTVTTTVQPGPRAPVALRADLRVDDDGDPGNDELDLLDVGLLPEGASLPVDVDVVGDASMASVGEGAFGVSTGLEPGAAASGAVAVLAVRLRQGVPRARLTVRLVATASVPVGADGVVTVDVAPRPAVDASTNDAAGAAP